MQLQKLLKLVFTTVKTEIYLMVRFVEQATIALIQLTLELFTKVDIIVQKVENYGVASVM